MKATGIVRRIEARVIITQKSLKPAYTPRVSPVYPAERSGVKIGF